MQEEKQNISPIKQRILQFVEDLGISKRDFYSFTGISRGTLESKTGITEDTLTKLFAAYPDLSPVWVFTGGGEKLQQHQNEMIREITNENIEDKLLNVIAKKDAEIRNLAEEVGKLKQEVVQLKTAIEKNSGGSGVENAICADAG
jgi:hypothetical protein